MENTKNFNVRNERNLTMLVDFYEFTMGNGYLKTNMGNRIAYFDMFFRKIPDNGGYCIMAGVQQVIEYLSNLSFTDEDIEYLRSKKQFSESFLNYLKDFRFCCDVWAIPEGTPIFPNEPLITVRGPAIQAQFVETMILLTVNHQTLIATKASRICRAAGNRPVMEFGSRRAQAPDAAIYGARAAVIGGCSSTACTISEQMFGMPAVGTMAHSWIQLFPSEYESFKAWAEVYPDNCVLLIDTYNVLKSGLPNAIKVFKEILIPNGHTQHMGVRIDSGDITYLTKECRKILDRADLEDVNIVISNSLDEFIITDVLREGACIDSFGVGERLITAKSEPVFGGVYKLSAIEDNKGTIIPKIKISENEEKITNPGFKKVYRIYSKKENKAIADLITLEDEKINKDEPIEIFDPVFTWKKKKIKDYYIKNLKVKIFDKGKLVYNCPNVLDIKNKAKDELSRLWPEVLRFENPHHYYVDLSEKLWNLKHELLNKYSSNYQE